MVKIDVKSAFPIGNRFSKLAHGRIIMPKQKTRKSVAKRFKKTATGKIKRESAGRGHLFTNKSSKQKRRLRAGALVADADVKRLIQYLPK